MIPTQRPPSLITGTPGNSWTRSTFSTDSTGSVLYTAGTSVSMMSRTISATAGSLRRPRPHKLRAMTDFWAGRRVLLTGHTGFKGGWLALWLHRLGAEVTGFSAPPATDPALFELARVGELLADVRGDVRDPGAVADAVAGARPEVVLHLAAQPLVRRAWRDPVETYAVNALGTVH